MGLISVLRRYVGLPSGLLTLVLCGSTAIIVRQGQRILALEDSLSPSQPGKLSSGTTVHSLRVQDLKGRSQSLVFSGTQSRPTILYVFRPECVWCRRNSSYLKYLYGRVANSYDIVGLSLTSNGVQKFVEQTAIAFPVYTGLSAIDINSYHLGTTPETIVISSSGKVIDSWLGAYTTEPIRSDVERFFSLRFPTAKGEQETN